jgi:hypothetical protein
MGLRTQLTSLANSTSGSFGAVLHESQDVVIAVTFPKYWPKSDGSYDFTQRAPQMLPAEGMTLTITDAANNQVWSGSLDDHGQGDFPATGAGSLSQILNNPKSTFTFTFIPQVQVKVASGTIHANVVRGTFSGGASQDLQYRLSTQTGGSHFFGTVLKLAANDSKMASEDAREAPGAMNILWVYKRMLQCLDGAGLADPSKFDNLPFWWDPTQPNDGITRYNPPTNRVYVRGDRTINSDDFDDGVLLHELGHKVHSAFGPYDGLPVFTLPAGVPVLSGDHAGTVAENPELAWVEGWADFFQAAVKASSFYPADPSGHKPTADFDSGPNGKATVIKIDPATAAPTSTGATDADKALFPWDNEWWVARGLWLAYNDPAIVNGNLAALTPNLPPGTSVDSFQSFLDRLGAGGSSTAITTMLSTQGFSTPTAPHLFAQTLALNAPVPLDTLAPQANVTLQEGSDSVSFLAVQPQTAAYFLMPSEGGPDGTFTVRIGGIGTSQADINNIGLRFLVQGGGFLFPSPAPPDGFGGWVYDPSTSTWMAHVAVMPFLTLYNRSTTKTYSNLTISVTP